MTFLKICYNSGCLFFSVCVVCTLNVLLPYIYIYKNIYKYIYIHNYDHSTSSNINTLPSIPNIKY